MENSKKDILFRLFRAFLISIIIVSVIVLTNPSLLGLDIQKQASLKEIFPVKLIGLILVGLLFLNGILLIISKEGKTRKLCIKVYKEVFFISFVMLILTVVSG